MKSRPTPGSCQEEKYEPQKTPASSTLWCSLLLCSDQGRPGVGGNTPEERGQYKVLSTRKACTHAWWSKPTLLKGGQLGVSSRLIKTTTKTNETLIIEGTESLLIAGVPPPEKRKSKLDAGSNRMIFLGPEGLYTLWPCNQETVSVQECEEKGLVNRCYSPESSPETAKQSPQDTAQKSEIQPLYIRTWAETGSTSCC